MADHSEEMQKLGLTPVDDKAYEAQKKLDNELETSSEPPGMIESFMRSLGQGSSMDFKDEIRGVQNAIEQATGGYLPPPLRLVGAYGIDKDKIAKAADKAKEQVEEPSIDKLMATLKDEYKSERNKSRAEQKAAEQAHPTVSMLGNIVGGLPLAFATGAGGAAKAAAQGAPEALQAVARSMGEGVLAGGVAGAGYSEGATPGDVAYDAAKSAAIGGIISPVVASMGLPLAQQAGSTVAKIAGGVASSEPIQHAVGAFKQGVKGRSLLGKGASERVIEEGEQLQNSLNTSLQDRLTVLKDQKEALLKTGSPVEMKKWYDSAKSVIQNARDVNRGNSEILSELDKLEKIVDDSVLGAEQQVPIARLNQVGNKLEKTIETISMRKPVAAGENLEMLPKDIDVLRENIGPYGSQGTEATKFSPKVKAGINRILTPAKRELEEREKQIMPEGGFNTIKDRLEESSPGISPTMEEMHTLLNAKEEVPGIFDLIKAGKSSDVGDVRRKQIKDFLSSLPTDMRKQVEPKINDFIEQAEARAAISQKGLNKDVTKQLVAGGAAGSAVTAASNIAGLGVGGVLRGVGQAAAPVAKTIGFAMKPIYKLLPDELQQASNTIVKDFGEQGSKLATKLMEASKKDSIGKNAILFSIMQDPGYRKMLYGEDGIKATEEQANEQK